MCVPLKYPSSYVVSCPILNDKATSTSYSFPFLDTSVRLTGANVMYAGRVEVRYAGIWGRACSRNWGANETNVVCRQLGYRGAFKGVVTTQRIFGKGEGPAWLQIDCQGDEKSLEDCSKGEWGLEDCSEDINARTSTNAICMVTESSNESKLYPDHLFLSLVWNCNFHEVVR